VQDGADCGATPFHSSSPLRGAKDHLEDPTNGGTLLFRARCLPKLQKVKQLSFRVAFQAIAGRYCVESRMRHISMNYIFSVRSNFT